jgi:hypothetical protein
MGWGFVWLMVILKIPIAMLLYLVWWAVRQVPDDAAADPRDDEGGEPPPHRPRPHRPRPARRGPHGALTPHAPQRVRVHGRRPPRRAPSRG